MEYIYDLVGKIRQVTDPTGTYGFAYDNMGRLIGTTTQYAFLPGHAVLEHVYLRCYLEPHWADRARTAARTAYSYDTLNRLTGLDELSDTVHLASATMR